MLNLKNKKISLLHPEYPKRLNWMCQKKIIWAAGPDGAIKAAICFSSCEDAPLAPELVIKFTQYYPNT